MAAAAFTCLSMVSAFLLLRMSEIAARPFRPTGTPVLFYVLSRFFVPYYTFLGLVDYPGSRFDATVVLGTLKLMSVIARLYSSFSLGFRDFLCRCMKPKASFGLFELTVLLLP